LTARYSVEASLSAIDDGPDGARNAPADINCQENDMGHTTRAVEIYSQENETSSYLTVHTLADEQGIGCAIEIEVQHQPKADSEDCIIETVAIDLGVARQMALAILTATAVAVVTP
jgi:hypothetical protein